MKQIKTLLRILVLVFVSLVVGINLYTWNAKSLMGNALPMPMGYGAAIVLTGSMEPTIMEDDLILVAKKPVYAVGDIVVYQSGNILVVHRIVDIADGLITTRGDANQTDDAPVEASAIKGKVISIIPWMGSLARILKTPAATIILLVAAVLMLESSFRKEKRKKAADVEQLKAEIRKLKAETEYASASGQAPAPASEPEPGQAEDPAQGQM